MGDFWFAAFQRGMLQEMDFTGFSVIKPWFCWLAVKYRLIRSCLFFVCAWAIHEAHDPSYFFVSYDIMQCQCLLNNATLVQKKSLLLQELYGWKHGWNITGEDFFWGVAKGSASWILEVCNNSFCVWLDKSASVTWSVVGKLAAFPWWHVFSVWTKCESPRDVWPQLRGVEAQCERLTWYSYRRTWETSQGQVCLVVFRDVRCGVWKAVERNCPWVCGFEDSPDLEALQVNLERLVHQYPKRPCRYIMQWQYRSHLETHRVDTCWKLAPLRWFIGLPTHIMKWVGSLLNHTFFHQSLADSIHDWIDYEG